MTTTAIKLPPIEDLDDNGNYIGNDPEFMEAKMRKEYLNWFKSTFNCLPNEVYMGVQNIREFMRIRDKSVLINNLQAQEKYKVLTFEEYKNSLNESNQRNN